MAGRGGFRLAFEGHTLLIDPYLSRAPLSSLIRRRPALPDPAMLHRFLDVPGEVDGVLVGHTHFDHAVDAPDVARRFECPALGSRSLGALMRLHGLGDRFTEVEPYLVYELGPFAVTFVPSAHSRLVLGRAVPFDGEVTCESLQQMWLSAYRCGQVWGIHVEVAGARLYHQGSAALMDYWGRILRELEPRVVVATHFDDFFRPLTATMGFAPNVRLARLPEEIRAVARDVEVRALPLLRSVSG